MTPPPPRGLPSSPNSSGNPDSARPAPKNLPDIVTATSLGPWPGTDPVEASKVGLGLLPEPHLPGMASLPARGVGSDAVGRTAALLLELPVDVQPYGWRFVDRPGHDQRRAASALSTDINVLADVVGAGELVPEHFKAHIMGPASLAAAIHLHYGERSLSDHGARRDIAQSLAAGLQGFAGMLRAAVPGAALTLQIDEPDTAPVLAGTIPTASGYRTLRPVTGAELRGLWSELVAAARGAGFSTVAINLAPDAGPAAAQSAAGSAGGIAGALNPDGTAAAESTAWRKGLELALESGVDAVAVPLHKLDTGHWELLARALESGMGVWAGTVPARPGRLPPSYASLVEKVMVPWRGLGLPVTLLPQLRITPSETLAGLSPAEARRVLERVLEVAEELSAIRYR